MGVYRLVTRRLTKFLSPFLLAMLTGCNSLSDGFLVRPAGPVADLEHHEFLVVCAILVFVWVPVFILVPLFAWHYRISNERAAYRPQWGFNWILEGLIWIPPVILVVVLSVLLVRYTTRLDPYKPVSTARPSLQIDVVALDWKWLFLYPTEHIATVNELYVPVGVPVEFELTSGTVMQSLLMPRLAGQIYAMNGMKTKLNFEVGAPGNYLGENTQYNGDGFYVDHFTLHAVPETAFNGWVAKVQANGRNLDIRLYQHLSTQSILNHSREYGSFMPDLFEDIVGQKIPSGYLAQHHEAGGNE